MSATAWLSVTAVAQALGVTPADVSLMIERGELTAAQSLDGWLIDPATLPADLVAQQQLRLAQQQAAQRQAMVSPVAPGSGSPTAFDGDDAVDLLAEVVSGDFGGVFDAVGQGIGSLARGVADAAQQVGHTAEATTKSLSVGAPDLSGLSDNVAATIGGVTDGVSMLASSVVESASGVIGNLTQSTPNVVGGVARSASNALGAVAETASTTLGGAVDAVGSVVSGIGQSVGRLGASASGSGAESGGVDSASGIGEAAANVLGAVGEAAPNVAEVAGAVGEVVGSVAANVAVEGAGAALEGIGAVLGAILDSTGGS